MNIPGKRILLGTAVAVAALGVGGIAYAAGNDPVPEQGYVTVEEGTSPQQGNHEGRDCPQSSEQTPAGNA